MTRVGFDIGDVIVPKADPNSPVDTDLRSDNFTEVLPANGAFETIAKVVAAFGASNVFIISKCGKLMEQRSRWWLVRQDFYNLTGFSYLNLYFCKKRSEKAIIAQRLKLDVFVDDLPEVLGYMKGIVPNRYLFGPQAENETTDGLIVVQDWNELRQLILPRRIISRVSLRS